MNIAIIDSHPIFRTGLREFLAGEFHGVRTIEAKSMHTFEQIALPNSQDVIIIGLSEEIPCINQARLTAMIKRNPDSSIIVYAIKDTSCTNCSFNCTGVRGFLTKSDSPDELTVCIREVVSGGYYKSRTALLSHTSITNVEFY